MRDFIECAVLVTLIAVPAAIAEQWYGINWYLAVIVTGAVVIPLAWKPLRLRNPWG